MEKERSARSAGERRRPAALALVALLLAFAGPPAATPRAGGAEVSVSVGFDGWFRPAAWSPLRIEITSGPAPFRGELILKVPRTTLLSVEPAFVHLSLPVEQEAGARTVRWLTLPLQDSPHPLEAALITTGGRTLDRKQLSLREAAADGPIVLVLDPQQRSWTWLRAASGSEGGSRAARFGYAVDATRVPGDPLALSSLAAIVITSEFPLATLSDTQVEAIRRYVEVGGNLILVGGAAPPAFGDAWRSWLPPLATGEVFHVDTPDGGRVPGWRIASEAGAPPPEGGALLARTVPYGAGHVTLFAVNPLNPAARPLLAPGDWALPFERPVPLVQRGRSPLSDEEIWRLLEATPVATRLPPAVLVGTLGYVVAVAALLLAARRRALLFALVPLLAAGGVWLLGSLTSAPGLRERAGYVELQLGVGVTDGILANRTYGTLASTSPRFAQAALSAPTLFPFPAAHDRAGDIAARLLDREIVVEAPRPPRPIRIVHEMIEDFPVGAFLARGGTEAVYVENRSGYRLDHAYVVERDRYYALGTVDAGQRRTWSGLVPRRSRASWVALGIQSELERMPPPERPADFEIAALVLAIARGLDDPFFSGRRDEPLFVALVESPGAIGIEPPGYGRRARAVVLPVAQELPDWAGGGGGR